MLPEEGHGVPLMVPTVVHQDLQIRRARKLVDLDQVQQRDLRVDHKAAVERAVVEVGLGGVGHVAHAVVETLIARELSLRVDEVGFVSNAGRRQRDGLRVVSAELRSDELWFTPPNTCR